MVLYISYVLSVELTPAAQNYTTLRLRAWAFFTEDPAKSALTPDLKFIGKLEN